VIIQESTGWRRLFLSVTFIALWIVSVEGTAGLGLVALGYPAYHRTATPRPAIEIDPLLSNPIRSEKHPWGAWGIPNTVSRHVKKCFDVEYRFNSFGARDAERTDSARLPGNRWLVLGDSFVEGFGIAASERITNGLERRLGKEFMNFGMSGSFGPLQYLLLYRRLVEKFEHDGLIVGFLASNDFSDNNVAYWTETYGAAHARRYRPYLFSDGNGRSIRYGFDSDGVPREDLNEPPPLASPSSPAVDTSTGLQKLVRTFSQWSTTVSLARHVRKRISPGTEKGGYFVDDRDLIEDAKWAMNELAIAAGKRKRIVLVLPSDHDLHRRAKTSKTGSREFNSFLSDLRQSGWTVIDTAEAFEPLPRGADITLGCDPHWNAQSNQRVVDFLISRHSDKF
jgi:hypothetical protein